VLGQGGLVDAAGGTLRALGDGDILSAVKTAGTTFNTFKNLNLKNVATAELNAMLRNAIQNTPNTRNSLFNFPKAGASPGPIGTAAFPTIGARLSPPVISDIGTAGNQYNGADLTGDTPRSQQGGGNLPISDFYLDALERSGVGEDEAGDSDPFFDEPFFDDAAFDAELDAALSGIDDPFVTDYKIKKGDNLTKIAKANGTTVQALLKENPNIKNPNLIYAGETIKIPTNKTPTVLPKPNNTDKEAFDQDEFDTEFDNDFTVQNALYTPEPDDPFDDDPIFV
jgi:LysM repeat protein